MALEGAKVGVNANFPFPPVLYKTIRIPNVNVRALFSTPFQLIPAAGVDRIIFPELVIAHKPAGTAFTGGTNLQVGWSAAFWMTVSVSGFLDQVLKKTLISERSSSAAYTSAIANTDLSLSVSASNPATSLDTDLFVYLAFRVWENNPLPWM